MGKFDIKEELRKIPNFSGYYITLGGDVWSYKGKTPKKLKYYLNNEYPCIGLYNQGKRYTKSVSKLVRKVF
jgi:hypothetical protein